MHKKLAADLTSLAHSILQMKDKDDVLALQKKAHEVYEKLSVLAYVEEYIRETPNPEFSKDEILEKIEAAAEKVEESKEEVIKHNLEDVAEEIEESIEEEVISEELETASESEDEVEEEPAIEEVAANESEAETVEEENKEEEALVAEAEETIIEMEDSSEEVIEIEEEPAEEQTLFTEEVKEEVKAPTLEEELEDTIAVDVVADLFENAPKKSLNDKLHGDIQIGLNDRIAFVKNLFNGSQEDFNRVVSQLNTFKTEKEAKKFITKMVKPDYDWTEKEEFEERFMGIVERKFA